MPFRLSQAERADLVATLTALKPDQTLVYRDIHVSLARGKWWTQEIDQRQRRIPADIEDTRAGCPKDHQPARPAPAERAGE